MLVKDTKQKPINLEYFEKNKYIEILIYYFLKMYNAVLKLQLIATLCAQTGNILMLS